MEIQPGFHVALEWGDGFFYPNVATVIFSAFRILII